MIWRKFSNQSSSGCVFQGSRVRINAFVLVFYSFLRFDSRDLDQLTTCQLFSTYPPRIDCLVGRGKRTLRRRGWGTTSAPLLKVSPRGCQANKPGKGEALVANCVLTTRKHKARALIDSLLVYLPLSLTLCFGKSFSKAQVIVVREYSQWLEIDREISSRIYAAPTLNNPFRYLSV